MHKEYFNCYKFSGTNDRGSRASVGMSFLMYIYDIRDRYSVNLNGNGGKGAMLTIVEKGSFLNPYTKGVEILPNKVNRVKFSPTNRIRLPEPWGNCLSRDDLRNSVISQFTNGLNSPYLYTEDSCISTCIEYNINKTCGCHDVGQYGILLDVFKNVSMCGATSQGKDVLLERMKCAQKWRSHFRAKCVPKCPPPCQEESYNRQITYLEMSPSEIMQMLDHENIQSTVPDLSSNSDSVGHDVNNDNYDTTKVSPSGHSTESTTDMRTTTTADDIHIKDTSSDIHTKETTSSTILDHISELNISSMALIQLRRAGNSYFIVEDIKSITASDFLAKIGGTLNLWSGITVFVLVELLDLIIRLVAKGLKAEQQVEKRVVYEQDSCYCHHGKNREIINSNQGKQNGGCPCQDKTSNQLKT